MSVDETATDPAEHYDKVTDAWGYLLGENLHYGYFDRGDESLADATERLTRRMAELAQPAPENLVLDVGCGTGQPARCLAQWFGCRVTGISPSQVCIDRAAKASAGSSVEDLVHFELGDAMAMPYADASYDRVWVMESSHLMPDKSRLMSEAARLLKPDGRLVLCDVMLQRRMPLLEMIRYRDDFLLLHDVFGRARMETLDFYVDEAEAKGLTVELREDITAATRPTFECWRRNAEANRDAILSHLVEADWNKFFSSCKVLEKFWDTGVMGYGLLAARRA
jgi:cyclopropane fatty-acyl-phospholipid synthase-like methyltransferase